ncbi:hypothetical protein HOY80DRAFT_1040533 [Tuber brumale]|nr:hypothetical protein HOY80DRAFT_1040533 [Tuber brumale]
MRYRRALGREETLGLDHQDTIQSVSALGVVLRQEMYDEAEAMRRRALTGREKTLGLDNSQISQSVGDLGVARHRAGKTLGLDHRDAPDSASNPGVALYRQGRQSEAGLMYRRALEGERNYSGYANNLGAVLHDRDKLNGVKSKHRHAAGGSDNALWPHRPGVLSGVGLAMTLLDRKYQEAEVMYRHALGAMEKARGPDHLDSFDMEAMCRRALAGKEKTLGLDRRDTLLSAHNFGVELRSRDKHHGAENMYRRALIKSGTALYQKRKHDEAEIMYRRAVREAERYLGPRHPVTLKSFNHLSMFLFARAVSALDGASLLR